MLLRNEIGQTVEEYSLRVGDMVKSLVTINDEITTVGVTCLEYDER